MAIYHLSTKPVSRSSGRTATASIAYRAGIAIKDERTGKEHDYTKRSGVAYTQLHTPNGLKIDRNELWNLAETTETRKNSRTAREIVVNLPYELSGRERIMLVNEFAKDLATQYGVAVDVAIHTPDAQGDNRNHHAHIMLTTRKAELSPDNKLILTNKADIELSNAKRKTLGMGTTQEEIKQIRKTWANLANFALDKAGYREKIDHRSYTDQGNGLQATIHEGTKVTQLRRCGIETEISRFNDNVKQHNNQQLEQNNPKVESVLKQGLDKADQGFEQWQKNQGSKRLELEQQAQIKRQQELDKQRAEQALRKASQKLDRGGYSL